MGHGTGCNPEIPKYMSEGECPRGGKDDQTVGQRGERHWGPGAELNEGLYLIVICELLCAISRSILGRLWLPGKYRGQAHQKLSHLPCRRTLESF